MGRHIKHLNPSTWATSFRSAIVEARRVKEPFSLKAKLMGGSTAIAVTVLLLTYFTLSWAASTAASKQADNQALQAARAVADAASEAVAARDTLQLHVFAESFLKNGVFALSIVGSDGHDLYASRKDLPPARRTTFDKASHRAPGVDEVAGHRCLHATGVVRFGDRAVGSVHVWIERDDLDERIEEASAYVYPILAFGFVAMWILGSFLLYTSFRSLDRLTSVAERIRDGDFGARVPVDGNDEIAQFCEVFNDMTRGLERARNELCRQHIETIHAMIDTVEAKDAYTDGHCVRVSSLTKRILERYDLPPADRFLIETAALLHDIGKVGVPDHVLLKDGKLDREETEIVRSHVILGESILSRLGSMEQLAPWVRHHHERWDGQGYPDGISGTDIPFASRVIAVADTIDAMLADRPYRRRFSSQRVVSVLREEMGKQFDPRIVRHAIAVLESTNATKNERESNSAVLT